MKLEDLRQQVRAELAAVDPDGTADPAEIDRLVREVIVFLSTSAEDQVNAAARHPKRTCLRHLAIDVAQPKRPLVGLNAGFGNEQRSPIPGMDIAQDVMEWPEPRVVD